ncbi:MAG: hypothetical protein IPL20_17530 [Saprospiraceae bacterium]|nr:hypothetical protein [Saprospiraceae bacterium]
MFKGEDNHVYVNPFFNGLVVYKYEQGHFVLKYKINDDFNINDRYESKDTIILATTKGILIINKNKVNTLLLTKVMVCPIKIYTVFCLTKPKKEVYGVQVIVEFLSITS